MSTAAEPAASPPPVLSAGADYRPLHPRARWGMRLWGVIAHLLLILGLLAAVLILAAALGVPRSGLPLLPLAAGLGLLGGVLGWRYGGRRWRLTRWRLDARGLEIRRGVYWHHDIRVPRARVQHTDLHRGPLDRRWGMADLVVYTAGSEQAAVRLGGLDAADAQALRDALLQGHDEQL
jgi:uncharacterized protein